MSCFIWSLNTGLTVHFFCRCTVSIRDILSWVQFINTCSKTVEVDQMSEESGNNQLEPAVAYIHGACLVFLDGLGAGKVVNNLVSCIPDEKI